MTVHAKLEFDSDEFALGLCFSDGILMSYVFWRADLTLEGNEEPELSLEQKIMFSDESDKLILCTGRKIAKCVAGDTVLYDADTGERRIVKDIFDSQRLPTVNSLDSHWHIVPSDNISIEENEIRNVYSVTTKSGFSIKVSDNHPFLSETGWVECKDLKIGDLVGVPKKTCMPEQDTSGLSDAEIALLAYLIGDGCVKYTNMRFSCGSPKILADFDQWIHEMNPLLRLTQSTSNHYDYNVVYDGKHKRWKVSNPLNAFIRKIGLYGTGSYTKFVPDEIFRCDKRRTTLFLNRIYATDGYSTRNSIGYTSMSLRLIEGIRELLLRFGVYSRIYPKHTWCNTTAYTLEICDGPSILKFAREINIFSKEDAVARTVENVLSETECSKHDRIPVPIVRSIVEQNGMSTWRAGQNAGLRFKNYYKPSRDKVLRMAKANGLKDLLELAEGDVYWEQVESVEPVGQEMTYDLEVPETHNFVANGFITHNSILLESRILRIAVSHEDTGSRVEGLITVPSQKDMALLYNRVMTKFHSDPLIMSLIEKETGGENLTTLFRNKFVWLWRIEGLSGRDTNMRGIRAAHILGDEQQGSNQVCHDSRKMSALPNCTFLYAGVPDGVRSTPFFQLDQTHAGDGWSKHKYSSYINPIFQSEKERDRLVKDNGGRSSMTYLTQVMGQWGDETVSSFPAGSISVNGNLPIFVKEYSHDMVSPYATTNTLDILFGDIPKIRCHSFAVGIDYGSTSDPTVMTFVYRRDSLSPWNQYLRLTFSNVEFPHLISIIKHFIRNVFIGRLTGLCSDLIALVQTLISDFTDQPEAMRIFAAVPGGTTIQLETNGKEKKDATGKVLRIRNKQFYHELLRAYMTNANLKLEGPQLFLGQDDILIEELRGTTERRTPGGYTEYYSSQMYRGGYLDHNRESATYMCAAIYLGSQLETDSFSENEMLEALGFAGGTGEKVGMPWELGNVQVPF